MTQDITSSFVASHTHGVGDFIQHRRFFRVPDHQRDFAWTEDEVEEFINDVVGAIKDSERDYFLGLLVVVEPAQLNGPWEILDGQQRLATTTMVYAAIREWLMSAGFQEDASQIQNAFIGSRELGQTQLTPRLTLNINNRTTFRETVVSTCNDAFLSSRYDASPRYSSKRRLIHAAITCRHSISQLALQAGDEPEDQAESLFGLAKYLRDQVKIVVMNVASTANAYRIFETLNDRGLDLTVLDLVKNHLFGRSSERLSEVQANWLTMLANISGRQADDFLKVFWTAKWGRVQRGKLFEEWRTKYDRLSPDQVVSLSAELDQAADRFSALEAPDHDIWNEHSFACKKSIKILSILGSRQTWPVMLAALESFNPRQMERLLQHLIVLIVRYQTIGRRRTGRLEIASARIAHAISKGEVNTPHKVWRGYSAIVPGDEEFADDFARWTESKSVRARYVLAELEKAEYKRDNQGEEPEESPVWEELTLEHILPKNPGSEWSSETSSNPVLTEEYIHRLGNLCLLQEKPNRRASSRAFFYKQKNIYAKSQLTLTLQIAELFCKWDSSSIDGRQRELSKLALDAWPLPPP